MWATAIPGTSLQTQQHMTPIFQAAGALDRGCASRPGLGESIRGQGKSTGKHSDSRHSPSGPPTTLKPPTVQAFAEVWCDPNTKETEPLRKQKMRATRRG